MTANVDTILKSVSDLKEVWQGDQKTTGERFTEFEKRFGDINDGLAALKTDIEATRRVAELTREQSPLELLDMERLLYSAVETRGLPGPRNNQSFVDFLKTQDGYNVMLQAGVEDRDRKTERGELIVRAQQAADDLYIVLRLKDNAKANGLQFPNLTDLNEYKRAQNAFNAVLKALDTTSENEWIPTGFSTELQAKIILQLRVLAQHPMFDMPTQAFPWPFVTQRPVAQVVSEDTGAANPYGSLDAARAFTTASPSGNVTFTAVKLRALEVLTREFEDDAIPIVVAEINRLMPQAIAEGWEDAILNGDTAAAHIDSDVVETGTSPKTLVDGLRDYVEANDSGGSLKQDLSNMTVDNWHALRAKMGAYGIMGNATRAYTSIWGSFKLMGLKDSNGNQLLLTMDKLGDRAGLIVGSIGELEQVPIIPSEFVREDLNVQGVYDAITTDKTEIILTRPEIWKWGKRPSPGLETERLTVTDSKILVLFDRGDIRAVAPVGDAHTVVGRNIATA